MFKDSVIAEKFSDSHVGGYVQINNLRVEVKVSDDGLGYIIDVFDHDIDDLIDTITVLKEDLMNEQQLQD